MRTISINTTQNVAIDYELAGLMERLLAFLLDSIILAVYLDSRRKNSLVKKMLGASSSR